MGSRFSDRGGCTVPNDTFVRNDLEPLVWLKRMVIGFDKFVGLLWIPMRGNVLLSFNNLRAVGSLRQTASSLKKGTRELRNLVSSVNYDGHSGRSTRGSVKSIGMDLDCCP